MENLRIQRTCKDCGEPFSISQKEAAWLEERGLALFARCKDCRAKRREQAKNERTEKI